MAAVPVLNFIELMRTFAVPLAIAWNVMVNKCAPALAAAYVQAAVVWLNVIDPAVLSIAVLE